MADSVRVCVFLCFLYNFCSALSSKEFFCQDPDTEELHHVNTTWSSTRFCGKYTCKLKKRILPDMDIRASNVYNAIALNPYDNNKYSFPEDNKKSELSITTKRELPEATTSNNIENDINNISTPKRDTDKDRYLNDAEIKSISELLHTIKKSDIDAIVEVYNLAQDIYKEMETKTTKNEKFNEVMFAERKSPSTSYWYDPLYHTDFTFDRVKDITLREQIDPVPSVLPSNFYPIYSTPYSEKVTIPYTVQRTPLPNIPYYYPKPVPSVPAVNRKIIPVQDILRTYPQYNGNKMSQPCARTNKVLKKQYAYYPYSQQMESVAKLLPLPFSYFNNYDNYFPKLYRQHFNSTKQNQQTLNTKMEAVQSKPAIPEPNTVLNGLPKNSYSQTVTQSPYLDIMNEGLNNDISIQKDIRATKEPNKLQDTLSKSLREKQDKLAPWQTLPLSQKILDEVKANILENTDNFLKPFTLKKKLRLDRVAKVLKLDDFERKRREIVEVTRGDVLEENDFEVFLEKITCEVETDPGLFSLGDLSLPFPECCPKKLNIEDDPVVTTRKQTPIEFTTPDTLDLDSLEINSEYTANSIANAITHGIADGKENATEKIIPNGMAHSTAVNVPLTALSSDASSSFSLPTALSLTANTDTLKLTTNSLGISTLSSTPVVSESTLKTSSSTPQTTTPYSPPTVITKTTPAKITPGEITPENTTPAKTLPEIITPANTTPANTTPAKTTPAKTTTANTTPEFTKPTVNTKTTPKLTTPAKTTPGKTTSEKTTPEDYDLFMSELSILPSQSSTVPELTVSKSHLTTTTKRSIVISRKKSTNYNKFSHLKF